MAPLVFYTQFRDNDNNIFPVQGSSRRKIDLADGEELRDFSAILQHGRARLKTRTGV